MASVEHPYNFNCPVYKFPLRTQKTIRVGFIGVGRRAKGIIAFFQLARSFSHWISAGELEFILVGGLESRLIANSAEDHRVTILAENGAGLAPHQYREAISELDCALFLSSQNYSLTASGSVFDALNAGIEILSLKSDYLADIAKYDPEGGIKLFDSLSEIELELKRRLAHGWPRRKFEYSQLKIRHAKESMNLLSVRLTS